MPQRSYVFSPHPTKKNVWVMERPGLTGQFTLEGKRMIANNVIIPGEYNPHNVGVWVIGNEFGPIAMVWAESLQDALDEAVDQNLMDSEQVPDEEFAKMTEDEKEDLAFLGNASEPFHQDYLWAERINRRDNPELMAAFAEAHEETKDHL